MYVPSAFDASDPAWCHRLIAREPFALVVTSDVDGVPFATHIPIELDTDRGRFGTLIGHVARQNPHVELLRAGRPTLAVFHGPHAYVSPSWYLRHPAVPTWNYVAVHATGVPVVDDDPGHVRACLARLVTRYEGGRAQPWAFETLPDDFVAGMVRGIVAFEMPIETLQGKAKLSQNRPLEDRTRVTDVLVASDDPIERALGALMHAERG